MGEYKILLKGGEGEIEEKKSRFIAHIGPAKSIEEAQAFIEEIKKKYWDARHNCSAFVIGRNNEITSCSDAGEPSGTAGRPMLEVLTGEEIHNVVVVVTRYFGGTLLGTGGLVRAYTDAVKTGLGNCEIVTETEGKRLEIRLGYTEHAKIQNYFKDCGQEIEDTAYGEDVRLTILVETGSAKERVDAVVDKTSGKAVIKDLGECVFLKKSLR